MTNDPCRIHLENMHTLQENVSRCRHSLLTGAKNPSCLILDKLVVPGSIPGVPTTTLFDIKGAYAVAR